MKWFKIILPVLLVVLLSSCSVEFNIPKEENISQEAPGISEENRNSGNDGGELSVAVVDVGQGDSILIKTPKGKYILVDTGSAKEEDKFFNYMKSQDIDKISVLVATHPHEDHIGNMAEVINTYDIANIYMPKVTSSTKTFKDMAEAMKSKGLSAKTAKAGVNFIVDGVEFSMLAPNNTKYDDVNNYSAVLYIKYGDSKFLLMGDAEKLSEKEILERGFNIKADVIKLGHHGSSSSSGKEFMNAVNPSYAVISCGKNNDYGHPHKETLKLLGDMGIKAYRTDISGTIVFVSDGKSIKIETKK